MYTLEKWVSGNCTDVRAIYFTPLNASNTVYFRKCSVCKEAQRGVRRQFHIVDAVIFNIKRNAYMAQCQLRRPALYADIGHSEKPIQLIHHMFICDFSVCVSDGFIIFVPLSLHHSTFSVYTRSHFLYDQVFKSHCNKNKKRQHPIVTIDYLIKRNMTNRMCVFLNNHRNGPYDAHVQLCINLNNKLIISNSEIKHVKEY